MSKGLPVLKMLIVGDSNVGKSSLLLRFVDDQFSPSFVTTVGIDFKIKDIVLPSTGQRLKLQIWDTAGQERFRTITNAYYRGAMAVIVVYDITNKQSFSHVDYWLSQVDSQATTAPIRMVVGNKSDLAEQRKVGEIEGKMFAKTKGCLFTEASAYNGRGVESMFLELAQLIQKPEQKEEEEEVVTIVDGKVDKKSCC